MARVRISKLPRWYHSQQATCPEVLEKYSRLAQETETEYVWRVATEFCCWKMRPRAFLTTDDPTEPWLLT